MGKNGRCSSIVTDSRPTTNLSRPWRDSNLSVGANYTRHSAVPGYSQPRLSALNLVVSEKNVETLSGHCRARLQIVASLRDLSMLRLAPWGMDSNLTASILTAKRRQTL